MSLSDFQHKIHEGTAALGHVPEDTSMSAPGSSAPARTDRRRVGEARRRTASGSDGTARWRNWFVAEGRPRVDYMTPESCSTAV